jgi:hypothetical protein
MSTLQMLHVLGEMSRSSCRCLARCCTSHWGCRCMQQRAGSPDKRSGG